jgi:hypothetical protein
MEEGSLLQQVLEDVQSRRDRQAHEISSFWTDNVLLIDVFCCCSKANNTKEDGNERVDDDDESLSLRWSLLQRLAQLAHELNDYIQRYRYPWHVGGDGLVFGIHTTDSIPHLRGACSYGANVQDEWMAIAMMKRWSAQKPTITNDKDTYDDVALQFWDVQDGHVLLIQTADVLPEWVDRIGPQACRYRCWMIQGQVVLVAPDDSNTSTFASATNSKKLSLSTAFQVLSQWCCRNSEASKASSPSGQVEQHVTCPRAVNEALQQYLHPSDQDLEQAIISSSSPSTTMESVGDLSSSTTTTIPASATFTSVTASMASLAFASHRHRTAAILPRSMASFFKQRPDLINSMVIMFQQLAESNISLTNNTKTWKTQPGEDWVWTTMPMSKTNYAMLRTIETPMWQAVDDDGSNRIPPPYQTTQTQQWQQRLGTPEFRHVQHALQLGIRLAATVDYVLHLNEKQQQQQSRQTVSSSTPSMTPNVTERRIQQHWMRIHRECSGRDNNYNDWRNEDHILEVMRNCPVYDPELLLVSSDATGGNETTLNPCPLTRPGVSLAMQIATALELFTTATPEPSKEDFEVPSPEDVDDEEGWMVLSEKDGRDLEEAYRQQSFTSPFAVFHHQRQQPQQSSCTNDNTKPTQSGSGSTDQQQLDDMLNSFQSFMTKPSEVEGVDTRPVSQEPIEETGKIVIQPRVFLNLLHAVLQASGPDDLHLPCIGDTKSKSSPQTANPSVADPYFSDDDYDMANSSDDEDDINEGGASLQEIMVSVSCLTKLLALRSISIYAFSARFSQTAMDEELRGTKASMDFDRVDSKEGKNNPELQQEAHVLSNLLKSLEAAGGGPGPVQSIMKEMGLNLPDLPASE